MTENIKYSRRGQLVFYKEDDIISALTNRVQSINDVAFKSICKDSLTFKICKDVNLLCTTKNQLALNSLSKKPSFIKKKISYLLN